MQSVHEVIIVGGGTTGAAAAYHLCEQGVKDMLCLEMGEVGRGLSAPAAVKDASVLSTDEEAQYSPFMSGSNVYEGGEKGPSTIKMVVTLPPYHVLEDFADHHGWDGVKVCSVIDITIAFISCPADELVADVLRCRHIRNRSRG